MKKFTFVYTVVRDDGPGSRYYYNRADAQTSLTELKQQGIKGLVIKRELIECNALMHSQSIFGQVRIYKGDELLGCSNPKVDARFAEIWNELK